MTRELQLENQKLKAKVRQLEMIHNDESGILGGMYEFVPDRQGSILGQGASDDDRRREHVLRV